MTLDDKVDTMQARLDVLQIDLADWHSAEEKVRTAARKRNPGRTLAQLIAEEGELETTLAPLRAEVEAKHKRETAEREKEKRERLVVLASEQRARAKQMIITLISLAKYVADERRMRDEVNIMFPHQHDTGHILSTIAPVGRLGEYNLKDYNSIICAKIREAVEAGVIATNDPILRDIAWDRELRSRR